VLASFIMLQILNGKALLTAFKPEPLQDFAGCSSGCAATGRPLPCCFLDLDSLYSSICCSSPVCPRLLAGFGVFSYLLIFVNAAADILMPGARRRRPWSARSA